MTQREDKSGSPLYRVIVLVLIAVVVGAVASLAAIAFIELVAFLNAILLISPRTRVQFEGVPWLVVGATVGVPTLGGLAVGLIHRHFSPMRRPLSPSDVIRSVQLRAPLPDAKSGIASTATAVLSLGSGASVGQYGPMVYVGAMVGGVMRNIRLRVPNLSAIAISCGVAAAISTAFNAPIAGLVFAHEVVLRHYSTQAFAPVTVASVTGFVVESVILDRPALFLVDFEGIEYAYEFGLFAALGLAAAALAIVYMRLILGATEAAERMGLPAELRPAAAGMVLGVTELWLPDVLGIGAETLRFATIEGAFGIGELVVLIFAKVALTALCIGSGFSGGVFSPALLIGALLGSLFWTLITTLTAIPTSGIAVFAISGMMAVASAVIGAPLTCILIVFELTRSYDVTIASMVAVVLSNLLSHHMFGRSLFDVQLARRDFDLSGGRDWASMAATPALEHATQEFVMARSTESVQEVGSRLWAAHRNEAFVVGPNGRFLGIFRPAEAARKGPVGALVEKPSVEFDEKTNVLEAVRDLRGFVGDAVPVVQSDSKQLLGVVPEAALIAAYLKVEQSLREEENAAL